MNHYEILEVSPNASPEVIKAAYRSLMQRYHPDRNPDNAVSAAHASLVVQAYAVLSDPSNRSAYDTNLNDQLTANLTSLGNKPRATARQPTRAGKDSHSYWLIWLLSAVIILSGGIFLSLPKNQLSAESELKELRLKQPAPEQLQAELNRLDETLSAPPENPEKEVNSQAKALSARTLSMFITDLTVSLKSTDPTSSSAHQLSIPRIDAIVGTFDPERVMENLARNKVPISQKLAERLADAKYEELIKVDSEHYLKEIILDSIDETTGTNRHKDHSTSGGYGVIQVSFPQSFSVH